MEKWRGLRRLGVELIFGSAFAAGVLAAVPASAGVGLAIVPDLPATVNVGEHGLGSLTITNANAGRHKRDSIHVFDITLTPSCGSQVAAANCPSGSEDPGVITIGPTATGRAGTACEGTVFTVTQNDSASGEVTFDPPSGYVTLGSANGKTGSNQCVIDFTFSVAAVPTKDSSDAGSGGIQTTLHTGAYAVSAAGARIGVGANWTTWQIDY